MKDNNKCDLCGCDVHRNGHYAEDNKEGRSHISHHHLIARRFFGIIKNKEKRTPIFTEEQHPFDIQDKDTKRTFCYECHEELLHNPVLLLSDIEGLRNIFKKRRVAEDGDKPEDRKKIGERIKIFREIISLGIKAMNSNDHPRSQALHGNQSKPKNVNILPKAQ